MIKTQKIVYEQVYKLMELHQIVYLDDVSKLGGYAYVVAYHQYSKSFYFRRYYAKT